MTSALPLGLSLAVCLAAAIEVWLARRNLRWLQAAPRPDNGDDRIIRLSAGRTRLAALAQATTALVALVAAAGGAQAAVTAAGPVGALVAAAALRLLTGVPFAACEVFVLRARAGLNSSSRRLFVADQAERLARGLLPAVVVAIAVGLLLPHAGAGWWALCWGAWMGLAAWHETAPTDGARCLRPLPPGPLARRIRAVAADCGVADVEVAVREESRRSPQLNARAEGIGRRRRIVLNDTLLAALSAEEVAAVAAHEAGHLAGHHRRLFLLWRAAVAMTALLLADGLGGEQAPATAAILLVLAAPALAVLARPLDVALIRRWEFDADRRAAEAVGAETMAATLTRLFAANAAAVSPEPLYAAFHSPHPTPAERLARLSAGRP